MSRTERFLGGALFGYAQQILLIVTGLWLTPFFLHHIGQRDYGFWLVGLQILTWLTLMDLGIVGLLPRETAYALGRAGTAEKASDLPQIIAQTGLIVLWQWPAVALAALALWAFLPSSSSNLRGPVAIVAAVFVLTFPLRIFRAVLEGLQDLHFLGRLQIICWAIGVITSVSLVSAGLHLYALAIGWAATQLLVAISCFGRIRTTFPYVFPSELSRAKKEVLRSHFSQGFWISIGQIAQVLLDGSDLLVIGKVLGSPSVVPYSCTEKLIGVLANQPTMVMHAAAPGLSAIKSSGDHAQAFQVAISLTQAMLLLSGAVTCVVLSINRVFVVWWVGHSQFAGQPLTLLLVVAMLLRHWNTSTVYSIFCFGYERRISISTLVDGLVTAIASFLLVRRLGFLGAPIGSIVGVCLVSLPLNLSALARQSRNSVIEVILQLWPWFWRFFLIALGALLLSRFWAPTTLPGIGTVAILVGFFYSMVMLPMLLASSLRAYLPEPLISVWKQLVGISLLLTLPIAKD